MNNIINTENVSMDVELLEIDDRIPSLMLGIRVMINLFKNTILYESKNTWVECSDIDNVVNYLKVLPSQGEVKVCSMDGEICVRLEEQRLIFNINYSSVNRNNKASLIIDEKMDDIGMDKLRRTILSINQCW